MLYLLLEELHCSILQGMLAAARRQGAGCVVSHDIVTHIVTQNILYSRDSGHACKGAHMGLRWIVPSQATLYPSYKLQRRCCSLLATSWSVLMMRMTMVMIMMVINARCGCILQNTLVANGARPLEPSHRASRCNEGASALAWRSR